MQLGLIVSIFLATLLLSKQYIVAGLKLTELFMSVSVFPIKM